MRFYIRICIIIFFFASSSYPATVNGRFSIVQINNYQFTVTLQINTGTGTDDLGGATIVFDFDTTSLAFPNNPVNNVDYTFHNFTGGNYSQATVTRPMLNQIWVNIDLPFINNNNGTIVAAGPDWSDVVTISFNVTDPNGTASLSWLTESPFWGIYDADNLTLWQTGQFTNLFGPLPVELISFTGTLLENDSVLLQWKTASSLNNAGFEIQKSYSEREDWEVIGFVESYGDPNALAEYSFTDYTAHRFPVIRYRLKSIDDDGSYEYSEAIEINTLPEGFELFQNYPNPFNPSTKIKYTIPETGNPLPGGARGGLVTLKVYDILGNEVVTLVNDEKQPGVYEVEFSARGGSVSGGKGSGLASGTYLYRLTAGNFSQVKKMVLLR